MTFEPFGVPKGSPNKTKFTAEAPTFRLLCERAWLCKIKVRRNHYKLSIKLSREEIWEYFPTKSADSCFYDNMPQEKRRSARSLCDLTWQTCHQFCFSIYKNTIVRSLESLLERLVSSLKSGKCDDSSAKNNLHCEYFFFSFLNLQVKMRPSE